MAEENQTKADATLEMLTFLLTLFGQLEAFLTNKRMQALLSDEELLESLLDKAGKNRDEAERIKARLRSLSAEATV